MADYQKRVELLEDDAFNFLTDNLNKSNHYSDYDLYNRTYQSQEENRQIPDVNRNGPLYTSQNIGSYVKTRAYKEEDMERFLKIKQETQTADFNENLPLYTSRVPGCPTSRLTTDIKEESEEESKWNNGPLFGSRVPDYMNKSRSDLKEEIEEHQPESYGPPYASHVDHPRSKINIKEEYDIPDVDANYRPLYTSSAEHLMPRADVDYRPQFEFSSQRLSQSDSGTIRPSGPNLVHVSQTSNMEYTPQKATNSVFQEPQNNLASGLLYIPKTSQNSMGLPCATNRPNLAYGDTPLQSNILNTAPANTSICAEPKPIPAQFSPQLDPNMFKRVPNTAPVNNVRPTQARPKHTHFSPQFEPYYMLNRVSNTFVPVTEPRPNLSHGLPHLNSNMLNITPNTTASATEFRPNFIHIPPQLQPNTLKRAQNIVPAFFNHISTQIDPDRSREPNVPITESMPNRTYSSPMLDSNMFIREPDNSNIAARFSELWHHLTHDRSKLESNIYNKNINTVPNTALRVPESRPNLAPMLSKLLNMSHREPNTALNTAVRVSETRCRLSHDPPQMKSNMSNTKINTGPKTNVLASSKANPTPFSPQFELNMFNREQNIARNTAVRVSESMCHLSHDASQLKSNMSNTKINTGNNTVRTSSKANLTPNSPPLELNMSNRKPNTALNTSVYVSEPRRQKSDTKINTGPITAVRVSESRPNLIPIPPEFQNKSNRKPNTALNTSVCVSEPTRQKCNTEINTGPINGVRVSESRPNLTPISSQFLNMSNREPNTAPNSYICASSWLNLNHGSQLHQIKNAYLQKTPQVANTSRKDVETRKPLNEGGVQFRRSIPNGNSQWKCFKRNKNNYFDWEKDMRQTIITTNGHSTKRNYMTSSKVTVNRRLARRFRIRYRCEFCSCIFKCRPTKHLKKLHGVKTNLWKHFYVYIKCQFCSNLIKRQSYQNHVKSAKCVHA